MLIGHKHTEESRLKMGISQKIRFANNPHWNKGNHWSDEIKKKMSLARTGICCGANHFNWKGDAVGYAGIHDWIEKEKGKPLKCDICGTTNAKKFEWCNKDHKYKRILIDWFRACTSCHRKYDYKFNLPNARTSPHQRIDFLRQRGGRNKLRQVVRGALGTE